MDERKHEQQHRSFTHDLNRHSLFVLILAYYLMVSVPTVFRIAPLAGPDEAAHYAYITYIHTTGNAPPKFQQNEGRTKRLEPPAYYTLVAIIASMFDAGHTPEFEPNPFYASTLRGNQNPVLRLSPMLVAARLATLGFGVLGLIGLYVGLTQWLGVEAARLASLLFAIQPNYLYFSATVNNDMAVTCVGLWILAAVIGIVQRGGSPLKHFGLGALWGLALLMQANALVLGLALPIVWFSEYRRAGIKPALRCLVDSLAGCIVLYGPWFLNRLVLSGPFDSAPTESLTLTPSILLNAFWPDWASTSINQLRSAYYVAVGCVLMVIWLVFRKQARLRNTAVAHLSKNNPARSYALALAAYLLVLVYILLTAPFSKRREIQPEAHILSQGSFIATETDLRYGANQAIALTAIEPPSATQGQRIDVPLKWHALKQPPQNYAVRAELVVPNGPQPLQLDTQTTFPGYGTSLTQDWRAGDVIADAISFYPTSTIGLNGPTRAIIVINLLQLPTPPTQTLTATLPVWRDGVAIEFATTQAITVRPAQPISLPTQFTLPTPPQFGESIRLAALTTQWANGKLHLTLWWQAVADVPTDQTPFVHVLGADGILLAQSDSVPNAGLSPTQFWRKGDVIRDEREIAVTQQPGLTLALGLYDSVSKERVAASQASQPLQDNVLRLLLP